MVDKPDFEKLKSKLDIGGILNSVKSMINPVSGTPDVDPDDDLGVKIAHASIILKEMAAAQNEHVKQLNKVNELLNVIFQDIESLRQEVRAGREKKASAESASSAPKAAETSAVEKSEEEGKSE